MPDGPAPSSRPAADPFRRRLLVATALLACAAATLLAWPSRLGEPIATERHVPPEVAGAFLETCGGEYRLEVRTAPRPLRIHHVKIDLGEARLELVAAVADDPDGDGPADATLVRPTTLAARTRAVVLVNANPWQSLPDAEGRRHTRWREGLPVDVHGLAASGGVPHSWPARGYCGFWMGRDGRPHVGNPGRGDGVREAVAGFHRLLRGGWNYHTPGGKRHPRTAVGLDADGRFLHLVVVDGRQPGYSEGVSICELAELMQEFGCADAVNLDGGGSSIMILGDARGVLCVVNDPGGRRNGVPAARPIPVALVARLRNAGTPDGGAAHESRRAPARPGP
jgi:hypothetical protein